MLPPIFGCYGVCVAAVGYAGEVSDAHVFVDLVETCVVASGG
jgi:hypothetical protein